MKRATSPGGGGFTAGFARHDTQPANNNLSLYDLSQDKWHLVSRISYLPSSAVSCISPINNNLPYIMPLLGIFFLLFEFSDVKDRIDDIGHQPDPVNVAENQMPANAAHVIGGIENKERA